MQSLENGSTSLLSSLSLVSTGVQVWGRRSSTSATSPAAARFTGRHPTSELTCAGTAARDPSSATGCSVGRDSPGATSCRDTGGRTQVRSPVDTLFVLKLKKKEKNNNKVTVLWSELMWGSRCRYNVTVTKCFHVCCCCCPELWFAITQCSAKTCETRREKKWETDTSQQIISDISFILFVVEMNWIS